MQARHRRYRDVEYASAYIQQEGFSLCSWLYIPHALADTFMWKEVGGGNGSLRVQGTIEDLSFSLEIQIANVLCFTLLTLQPYSVRKILKST